MNARVLSERAYNALKAACRRLVKDAGGQESAASITRIDRARIGRSCQVTEPMFMPLDVVADLERDTEVPHVTRELARLNGYVLVQLPEAALCPSMMPLLGSLAKEAGDVISRVSEALNDDGKVTPEEIEVLELDREVREAMEALVKISVVLDAIRDGAQ